MPTTKESKPQKIGVIITTYNQPEWLDKVLTGYQCQDFPSFQIIIADDGSDQATRDIIEKYKTDTDLDILHVWHQDNGFRKCEILNKAIVETDCDYLIFTDGDCIPEPNLVSTHYKKAEPGYFLSGGYIKLTMDLSKLISKQLIASGKVFNKKWLVQHGQPNSHKLQKLNKSGLFERFMNCVTPTKATWNGMNSSTWKSDLVKANGFNEDMQYGGLDRELGERLWNNGLKSKQMRYSTTCLHLEHTRGYSKPEIWKKNNKIRETVKREKIQFTANGIKKNTHQLIN